MQTNISQQIRSHFYGITMILHFNTTFLNKKKIFRIMKKGTEDKAQKKVVNDFCSMTGASEDQALIFLKRTNWNIQNSINLFFDQGTLIEKKEIKQTQQINDLFDSLSTLNAKINTRQIDEQKFAEFVQQYIKVDDQNLIIPHILINLMKVNKSGHISHEHFYNLFQQLGCQSPKDLAKYVKKLQDEIYKNDSNFKSMYMNTYTFYLVGKQITMQYEVAVQIWKLYLKSVMPYYGRFITYCQIVAKKPNRVHKDLWRMVYEFATTVKNVNSVKEDDGWPVFLDDFVEYLKQPEYEHII